MTDRPGRFASTAAWIALAIGLSACGGGGGGADTPTALPALDTSPVPQASNTSSLAADWQDGVFMEIFVRAYQDSDGDGIGDFKGLTSRLDYLKSLGVTGLWLMPIHPSQDGDHGYAVKDYRAVASEYGTLEDFKTFLQAAHDRGIGVITDYVINHSAAEHPAFVNAQSDASNAYRSWYLWSASAPSGWSIYGSNPWHSSRSGTYFGGFWSQMPDFNLLNEDVIGWHHDNLRWWLNLGVDGFRFDAVGNLVENSPNAWEHQPQNHTIMAGVRQVLQQYPKRFMVCEAPSDPQRYAQSDSCGSSFAFGYQYALASAIKGNSSDLDKVAHYWSTAPEGMVGFASNHDRFAGQRLADQFAGNSAQMRLAAATYLLQTPKPFIFYGEEIGMAGASGLDGDPQLRVPMSWSSNASNAGFTTGSPFRRLSANASTANVEQQETDSGSLLNFYRSVISLRRSLPALQRGRYESPFVQGAAFGFQRQLGGQTVVVALNYGATPSTLQVDNLPVDQTLTQHHPSLASVQTSGTGTLKIEIPARSFAVYSLGTP